MKVLFPLVLISIFIFPTLTLSQVIEGKRPDELPNIRITDLKVSNIFPAPSEEVFITMSIKNQTFFDIKQIGIRIQVNKEVIAKDNIQLASNQETELTFKWRATIEGRFLIKVIADPDLKLNELDRTDNIKEKILFVTKLPSNPSDFRIVSMERVRGKLNQIKVIIEKETEGDESQILLLIKQDKKLIASRFISQLSKGELSTQFFSVPDNIKYKHLSAEINPKHVSRELNSKNNTATLNLVVEGKDLEVRDLSVHSNKYIENNQRSVTLDFKIINLGNQDIIKPFKVRVRGTIENGRPIVGFINISSLKSNETTYVSYTFISAPKKFKISINVDINNDIVEVNENNNSLTDKYKASSPRTNRWRSIGPNLIKDINDYPWEEAIGRLSAIAINSNNPKIIYVGGQGSGIWKTNRGGRAWHPITNKISMSVAAIALDPNRPSTIFWATATEGFYRSDNDGLSWKQLTTENLRSVIHGGKLIVSPLDSNILFLASKNGVNKSLDGGITWSLVKQGANNNSGTTTGLVMDPINSNILYASFSHKTDDNIAGVFKTIDGGTTWRKTQGCLGSVFLPNDMKGKKITLAISKNNFYVGVRSSNDFQLYRSSGTSCTIGGIREVLFEKVWKTTTQHKNLWGNLWVNPLDSQHLYMGGTDFWRSINGGLDFEKVSDYRTPTPKMSAHSDHHAFAVLPNNKNVIFSLNDGGIYRSEQNAKKSTWEFIGKGISNVELYDFAQAFTDSNLLIGGTQDNGIIRTDGALEWRNKQGGDGATVDIDNKNKNIMYSLGQNVNSIRRSTNGGSNWNLMVNGLPKENVCFNLKFGIHPTKSNILLAPCNDLWQINRPNGTWKKIFIPNSGTVVRWAIDFTKNLYFAGTNNGIVSAGIDGNNWFPIFTHPLSATVEDIKVDPINPKIVWMIFAGNNDGRVYRLERSSTNTSNFISLDITSNLPTNLSVLSIAIERTNEHVIYVGTTKGVYQGKSPNQGKTWFWTEYNDGLPLAKITNLDVHPVNGIMRVSTYGRSAYQVSTSMPIGSTLSIEGKLNFLRIHDIGSKYGPPNDILDTEIIVKLDTHSRMVFGLKLRPGNMEIAHNGMLNQLRNSFKKDLKIRLEYVKTGINSGTIIRVINQY